jgi:hypothetical protein
MLRPISLIFVYVIMQIINKNYTSLNVDHHEERVMGDKAPQGRERDGTERIGKRG